MKQSALRHLIVQLHDSLAATTALFVSDQAGMHFRKLLVVAPPPKVERGIQCLPLLPCLTYDAVYLVKLGGGCVIVCLVEAALQRWKVAVREEAANE